MRTRAGFTLIEVMIAIAILALSLSAIFSSEAGAARIAHRSRKMGLAALLARCKMGEIEEQVAEEGLPAIFDSGSDGCCEDAEVEGFSCNWEIHPVVLPEAMFEAAEDEEGGDDPSAPSDPLGDLSSVEPQDLLSGASGMDGLASMALGLAYPVLKPSFESQIRRATVTVRWKEGSTEHDFDVTQYLVSSEPVQLLPDDTGATGAAPTSTGTTGSEDAP